MKNKIRMLMGFNLLLPPDSLLLVVSAFSSLLCSSVAFASPPFIRLFVEEED